MSHREAIELTETVRCRQFIWGAAASGPFCVLAAFVAFPYLGRWAYFTFHLACEICLLAAFVGSAAWIVQFFRAPRGPSFVSLGLLLVSGVGAIVLESMEIGIGPFPVVTSSIDATTLD